MTTNKDSRVSDKKQSVVQRIPGNKVVGIKQDKELEKFFRET